MLTYNEKGYLELKEDDLIFHNFDLTEQLSMLSKFGIERQSMIAMEECAELQKAVSKLIRYADSDYEKFKQLRKDLVEEIGDVMICIYQLKLFYEIKQSEIQKVIDFKQKRGLDRYDL